MPLNRLDRIHCGRQRIEAHGLRLDYRLASNARFTRRSITGSLRQTRPQTQKPHLFEVGFLFTAGEPDDYLLSHGQSALSSAWSRFTALFGMGRGGTDSLWSSGMTGCRAGFRPAQPIGKKLFLMIE